MAFNSWAIFVCTVIKWIARGWKWQIKGKEKKVSVLLFDICCVVSYLYAPPLSSGCTCCSTAPHGAVAIKYSLLTQFLRLSGIRPVQTQTEIGAENVQECPCESTCKRVQEARTCDSSSYLSGSCFSHLQRGLLTVPGCVRSADQIGSILQWTLSKTSEEKKGVLISKPHKRILFWKYNVEIV